MEFADNKDIELPIKSCNFSRLTVYLSE